MERNMTVEVEIISTQIIKPSTPTPKHLKQFNLSLLDQLSPWIYSPTIFFYNDPPFDSVNLTTRLKDSLSQTLSIYYPIAGRMTFDESTIECTDDGVPFIEARAKCTLSDYLKAPNRSALTHHFLPMLYPISLGTKKSVTLDDKPREEIVKDLVMLAVQLNIFECGGVAIGCFGLHKLIDATTFDGFNRWWGALTAAEKYDDVDLPRPYFATATNVFPPLPSEEVPKRRVPLTVWPSEKGECVVNPFTFSAEALAALRNMARSQDLPNPSRVEAVSAFIWKHCMAAANGSPKSQGPSVLLQLVNIRPHINPPLPPTSVGNFFMHAICHYDNQEYADAAAPELKDLVLNIRKSIMRAKDPHFLEELLGEEGTENVVNLRKQDMELYTSDINWYKFPSWCKLFDIDYGFGKPIWKALVGGRLESYFGNTIPLVETIDGGIEAWLTLKEHEMHILESDLKFLAFASPSSAL